MSSNGKDEHCKTTPKHSQHNGEKANEKHKRNVVIGPKNAECISKNGMVCCPCAEGIKYSYFAPTQCYVPMEYYVPVQCCVPVECEVRYGTPFIPGKTDMPPCSDK